MSIANPQSFNRYAYVENDPVNLIDPSGLWWGMSCTTACVSVDNGPERCTRHCSWEWIEDSGGIGTGGCGLPLMTGGMGRTRGEMQIENNNSITDKEEWERIKAKGKSRFILGKAVVYAITSSLIGLLISMFSPKHFSITVWLVIVTACAIGGYTSAKWKWSYYKQRFMKNDLQCFWKNDCRL